MDPDKRPRAGEVEERTTGGVEVDGKRIRGLVPYGVESRDIGGWTEIIEPTAFHSTSFDELRAVIDHKGVPLGSYPRTLQIEDRSDGLHWSLDPPKSRADVVEAIERGDMRAGSWRMRVSKDRWEGDVRHVEAIGDLYDVTLVGAELPAYPAAAVEYRSAPTEASEAKEEVMANEADKPQERQQRIARNQRGGLHVEDRVEVVPTRRPFFEEIAVAAREVSIGEVRSLTTAVSLSNPEYSDAVLRCPASSVRVPALWCADVDNAERHRRSTRMLTSDPTIGWVSEAGTITAIDPGLGAARQCRTSSRANRIQQRTGGGLSARRSSRSCGKCWSRVRACKSTLPHSKGQAPHPNRRHGQRRGHRHRQRDRCWHIHRVGRLRGRRARGELRDATLRRTLPARRWSETCGRSRQEPRVDSLLFPPSCRDLPTLWGATWLSRSRDRGGHARTCTRRMRATWCSHDSSFDVEINRARLFDSDRSEMRLRARLDYLYPYPGSIARGTGIP